jgi:hypothetical protein
MLLLLPLPLPPLRLRVLLVLSLHLYRLNHKYRLRHRRRHLPQLGLLQGYTTLPFICASSMLFSIVLCTFWLSIRAHWLINLMALLPADSYTHPRTLIRTHTRSALGSTYPIRQRQRSSTTNSSTATATTNATTSRHCTPAITTHGRHSHTWHD